MIAVLINIQKYISTFHIFEAVYFFEAIIDAFAHLLSFKKRSLLWIKLWNRDFIL